jgi:hypothetical protein
MLLVSSTYHIDVCSFDNDGGVEVLGPAMCKLLASLPRLTNLHLAWDLLSWEGTSVQVSMGGGYGLSYFTSVTTCLVPGHLLKYTRAWR